MSRSALGFVVYGLALLLSLGPARAALAALRTPQVPVLTNRLQSYLDSRGESIQVETDQLAQQSSPFQTSSPLSSFTLNLSLGGNYAGGDSIGIYNEGEASPSLMRVLPAESRVGWLAVLQFLPSPARLIVGLFDSNNVLQGSTTYPGAVPTNFGFYLQGPGGTFFMQDARNPSGAAQMLLYAGTGANSLGAWLCWEAQPVGAGSDQDYDDAVLFEECVFCQGDPVRTSTWGAIKQRYR